MIRRRFPVKRFPEVTLSRVDYLSSCLSLGMPTSVIVPATFQVNILRSNIFHSGFSLPNAWACVMDGTRSRVCELEHVWPWGLRSNHVSASLSFFFLSTFVAAPTSQCDVRRLRLCCGFWRSAFLAAADAPDVFFTQAHGSVYERVLCWLHLSRPSSTARLYVYVDDFCLFLSVSLFGQPCWVMLRLVLDEMLMPDGLLHSGASWLAGLYFTGWFFKILIPWPNYYFNKCKYQRDLLFLNT